MQYDPKVADLFESYPDLARRANSFDDQDFLRFLIYLISPDSPLATERNFDLRIDQSLRLLDQDRSGPIYARYELSTPDVHDQIFNLFTLYNDIQYETWFSLRMSFAIMNARLRDVYGLKDTDRTKITTEINGITEALIDIEYKLFPDSQIKSVVAERASEKLLTGYAERYALTLEQI